MNLPPRTLALKAVTVKEKPVLGLDTGFEADSLEGLRLVKASRGSGWFYDAAGLRPWVTRGVLQEDGRLVVWGDLDSIPSGETPEQWPRSGDEGREFLRAFVLAWTARASATEPLAGFSSASVVPLRTPQGWAFAFPPPELRGVLDSLQPLGDRLAWDHFRLPDAEGASSWAFTSAALGWDLAAGTVPWAQEEEAHLRQEIRELRRTLVEDELPDGPDPETLRLWFDSLTSRAGARPETRWKAWAEGSPSWTSAADPLRTPRRQAAAARRARRRAGASFWRRRGTVTMAVGAGVLVAAAIVGSVIWGVVKPDPTDDWTPEQVVRGYYAALDSLDADQMRKLTSFDEARQPALGRDEDEATNLYVIRQVRTAYEQQSPVVSAQEWENQGRPALEPSKILYGLADLEVTGQGDSWTVRYRKWVAETEEGKPPVASGTSVVDRVTLVQTGKGWKISGLERQREPLPLLGPLP